MVLFELDKIDVKGEKYYVCECVCGKKCFVRKLVIGRNIGCGCLCNKGIVVVIVLL